MTEFAEERIQIRAEKIMEALKGISALYGEQFDINNPDHVVVAAHDLGVMYELNRRINDDD